MAFLLLLTIIFLSTNIGIPMENNVIKINEDIELVQIENNFYIHTTWFEFPNFGRAPSNGLIVCKNGKAILIDTPNSNEQTEILYNYLKDKMNITVELVIVGHSHSDCLGGLSFLHSVGVTSISGIKTRRICQNQGLPVPIISFTESMFFHFEDIAVQCRYFGPGHTIDNIVVYFPETKILFGGCLIRSMNSKGLGYTKEADIEAWDKTVIKIKNALPEIRYVVPGHGRFGDSKLLDHTIYLITKQKK